MTMSFDRYTLILWFAISYQCCIVKPLETVDKLICDKLKFGSRIPHPEFCNSYIVCENNLAKSMNCRRSFLYNPLTKLCDMDYSICESGLIRNEDGSLSKFKKGNRNNAFKMASKEVLLSANHRSSFTPLACPIDDSDKLIFISHPTRCSVYFICYHGKPIPMECSKGLHWSENIYKCVAKELLECHTRSTNLYPKCPPMGIDFLPHDKDCQKFWYCLHGFRMIQQCDAFFHWDVIEKKCKRKLKAVCYNDLLEEKSS